MLKVTVARHFIARARGLLGRSGLACDEALLIFPCPSIHTAFMRFSIDAVFLDSHGRITHVVEKLAPWRLAFGSAGDACLELAAGGAAHHGLKVGLVLEAMAAKALKGRAVVTLGS